MKIIRLTKTAAEEHHQGAMGHPVGEPEFEAPKIVPSKRPFNKAVQPTLEPKPAPVIQPKQIIPEPVKGPVTTKPMTPIAPAPATAPVVPELKPAPVETIKSPEGDSKKIQSLSWAPDYVKQMVNSIPAELINTVGPQDFDRVDSKGLGRAKTLNGLIFKMKTEPWEAASFAREALWFRSSGEMSETGADKDTISHIIDKAHRKVSGDDPEWAYQPDKIVELALRSIGGNNTNLTDIINKIISSPSYRKKKGAIGVEDKVYNMTPEESSEQNRKIREIESLPITPEEKKYRIEQVRDEFDDIRRKRVNQHYKGSDGKKTTHDRTVMRVMEARDYEKDPERYPVPEHIAAIQDYPERLMKLYQWYKYGLARGNEGIMQAMDFHNKLNDNVVKMMPLIGATPSITGGEQLSAANGNWQNPKNALALRYMRNNYKDFMKAYDALSKDSPLKQDPQLTSIVKALRSPENIEGGANNLVPEMFDPGKNHTSVQQFKNVLNSGREQSMDVDIGGGDDDIKRDFGFVEIPTPILEETVHSALRDLGHSQEDIKEEIARQTSYAGDKRQALEWILQEQAPDKLDALKKEHSSGMEDTRSLVREKAQIEEEDSKGSNRIPTQTDMWQNTGTLEKLMDVQPNEIKEVIGDDRLAQGLETVKQVLTDKKFYNQRGSVPESLRDPQISLETMSREQREDLRKFMFSMRFKSRMNSLLPKAKDTGNQASLGSNLDKLANETYGQYTGILRDISSLISGQTGVPGQDGKEMRLTLPGARSKADLKRKDELQKQKEQNAEVIRRWFESNADKFQAPIRELGEDPGNPMARFRKAYYKVIKDMAETLAVMPQERYDGLFGASKVAKTDFVRMLRVARLACMRIA